MNVDFSINVKEMEITVNADSLGMVEDYTLAEAKSEVIDFIDRRLEGVNELRIVESRQLDAEQFFFVMKYKL